MIAVIEQNSGFITPALDETELPADSSDRLIALFQRNAKYSLQAIEGKTIETIDIFVSAPRVLSRQLY